MRSLYVYFERCIAIGWSGVDLFFVLSGFLIGGILLDVRESHSYFRTFYLRRFFRIVPIYYVWIGVYVVILIVAWAFDLRLGSDAAPTKMYEILAQLLFVQNLGFVHYWAFGGAWLTATWSLAVEEQFYLAAPVIVRFMSRKSLSVLLILVITFSPIIRMFVRILVHTHILRTMGLDPVHVLMPCRADGLAVGMYVAVLWRTSSFHTLIAQYGKMLYLLLGVFLAGFVALNFFSPLPQSIAIQSIGFTWLAISYALLLVVALARKGGPIARVARMGWLRSLGRISYCLYIIHVAVRDLLQRIIPAGLAGTGDWKTLAISVLALAISLGIANLSWIWFEEPLLRRGHTFKY